MPENDNKLNRFDKDESDAKTLRIRLVGISFVVMGLFSMFFLRRTEGWVEDYWRVMIGLLLIFGGLASIVWARSFANDEITDDENEITDNKTEVRDDKTEVRDDKTEVRDDKTEVRDDKTEVRDDKAEVADDEVLSWALVWANDAEAMARITDAEARLARAMAEAKTLPKPEATLGKVKEAWAGIVKAKARHAEACFCANKAEAEAGYKKTNATWAEAEAARSFAGKVRANANKAEARVAWTMVELAKAEVAWTEAEAARADETATWDSMIVRAKARLVKAETEYTKSIDCWSWQTNLWNWFKGSGNK